LNKSFFIFIPLLTSFICSCAFINESSSNKELSNNEYSKVIRSNEDNKNLNLGDESATRNSLNTSETSSNSGKINKVVLKKNIFEKISSNFSLKNLQSKRVKISLKRLTRDPKYVERVFNRSAPYLHFIVEEINKRNMPMELALLPFVESAYKTSARSSARAVGLWQFIPATGRRFDLKQNWWVDERRDVIKSTKAALDYLELLHEMMDGDWFLALASYNWGEASVRKAIKRNKARKKRTDYLYLKMPRETRYYVPKLLAVKEIVLNPKKYNISLPNILDQPYFEKIPLNNSIDFKTLSNMSGVHISTLKEINAGSLRPVVNTKYAKSILLPSDSVDKYLVALKKYNSLNIPLISWAPYTFQKGDTLKKVSKKHSISTSELAGANGIRSTHKFLKGTSILVPTNSSLNLDLTAKLDNFIRPKLIRPRGSYWPNSHKVRRGESLSTIAKKYRTSVRKIKNLNNLTSNLIFAGQRLRIYPVNQKNSVHRVKKGDSLYSIAMRYRTSVSELKRINQLASDIIKIGTKIVVR
tara:strand:- start:1158 stop:2741 length:1584 start_codon:yes stop_codon:yes gene_type:complete